MKNKYNLTENEQQILQHIINISGLSKANLAELTQLNKSTITYIVEKLIDRELVVVKRGVNTKGRNGSYLYFNNDLEHVLFFERSYNKLKVKVSNLGSELSYQCSYEIGDNFIETLDTILTTMSKLYPNIESSIFAVHGRIDEYQNKVKSPFFEIDLTPVREMFERHNIKLHIENEAKVHALGINRHRSDNVIVNIQIMEGVGSGIIINNKLFTGSNGMAGEIAHTIAVPNGKVCKCGNKGCFELYVNDQATLSKINKLENRISTIKDIELIRTIDNDKLNFILKPEIELISNLINNIYVTINPNEINITSRIYSRIDNFESTLADSINFRNAKHTEINILDYDSNTNLRGFCNLYCKLIFGFDK